MKMIISKYFSDDEMRSAIVYLVDRQYEVLFLDNYTNKEKTVIYDDMRTAEEYAEDWVL